MPSRRRFLKSWNDIALIEETAYLLIPLFGIEKAFIVTSERNPAGAYFSSLAAATKEYEEEIRRAKEASQRNNPMP